MSLRIRDFPDSRDAMYPRTDDSSAVASHVASSGLRLREAGQHADQRCGCDDDPWAFCTEHAALIIESL